MLDSPSWKKYLILLIMALALLYAAPNLFPQDPAVQIAGSRTVTVDAALKERVQGALEKAKVRFKSVALEKDRLLVRLFDSDSQLAAKELISSELNPNADDPAFTVALNLASTVPNWLRSVGARPMAKGLDLQGGVHFLMEVSESDIRTQDETRMVDDLSRLLRDQKLRGVVARGVTGPVVTLHSAEDRDQMARLLINRFAGVRFITGVSTGLEAFPLVGTISKEAIANAVGAAIDQNLTTLRDRINSLGVAEPVIQRQGIARIAVDLPGVQDTAAAINLMGSTSTLEYHAVNEAARGSGVAPPGSKLYTDRNGQPIVLLRRVIASGDQLTNATSMVDAQGGTPTVSVTLNSAGARKMLDFTQDNVGNGMAVVLVNKLPVTRTVNGQVERHFITKEEVISVATIRGVFGAQFQTTGLDSMEEASQLALSLKSGSLSTPLSMVEERVIGPSLGADNIKSGMRAVLIGFLAVILFTLFYYRSFGFFGIAGLLCNLVLLLAVLSVFGATLTMPGIAGLVLTLGMAIDANVLINERIKEELRLGNSPVASIVSGYEKAWHTIIDSNLTTLIAGVALFAFGSGPIRGFALVLCTGILTTMYTAVSVTHVLVGQVYGGGRKIQKLSI